VENEPNYRILRPEALVSIAKGHELFSASSAKMELLRRHKRLIASAVGKARLAKGQTIIEPDDLRQAAICAFLEALESFDPVFGIDLGAYACRFMLGAVLRLYPREQNRVSLTAVPECEDSDGSCFAPPTETEPGYGRVEDGEEVRRLLLRLPTSDRRLLVRTEVLGIPQATIARERGVSRMAVSKAHARAVRKARSLVPAPTAA